MNIREETTSRYILFLQEQLETNKRQEEAHKKNLKHLELTLQNAQTYSSYLENEIIRMERSLNDSSL